MRRTNLRVSKVRVNSSKSNALGGYFGFTVNTLLFYQIEPLKNGALLEHC